MRHLVVDPDEAAPALSVEALLEEDESEGVLPAAPEVALLPPVVPDAPLLLPVVPDAPVAPLLLEESLDAPGEVGLCATVVEELLDGDVLLGVVASGFALVVVLRSQPATKAVPRARMAMGMIFMDSPWMVDRTSLD